ncbi:hypothetical protein Fmac_002885 [Flemingia macrophylla]|uniref:Uncharacterized protein n=1 Tax=Flemingia macrophylla TaxID=520843 RepID=A0ABD1NL71_9FABA
MEPPFQGVIDDLLGKKFKEQLKDVTETEVIEKLVMNIEAEYGNSDLKGKVILKKMLVNVVTDMEKVDAETSNSNRGIISRSLAFVRSESSKSSSNDATRKKVEEGLERVKRVAKYLKRKKEKSECESVKEFIGREKEKEEIIDQLVLLSGSGDSPVPVIAISGLAGIGKTELARHVCQGEKLRKQVGFPAWVDADDKDNRICNTFDAHIIAKQVIRSVIPVIVTATVPFPTTNNNIIVILDDWRVDIEDKDVKELQTKVRGRWKKEIEDMYLDLKESLETAKERWRVDTEGIDVNALEEKLKEDGKDEIEELKEKVKECWGVEIGDQYDLKSLSEKLKKDGRVDIENKDLEALLDEVKRLRRDASERIDVEALKEKLKDAHPRVRAIMITTRNSFMVRKIGDSPVKSYNLAGLNDKESASLLEKTLGRGAGDDLRIAKIMGQCRGVPLAIITMAEWLRSSSPLTPEEQLTYSYYEVGEGFPHQCFAYFSLFPRDFLFDAERLIHLWMAEKFSSSEETSRDLLVRLVARSIFQDVKVDEFGEVRSFRMHPLMHDIAISVADWKDIIVDPNGHNVHSEVSRASLDLSLDCSRGISSPLFDKAKQLKTLICFANTQSRLPPGLNMSKVLENIFKSFKKLQALNLRDLEIKTVPSSIGELKELKYLDLSQNNMDTLPSSIANLTNLETLKLSRCFWLKKLPKDFEKLTRLQHLDIEGCLSLSSIPSHLGKLETLSAFVANGDVNDIVKGLSKLAELKKPRRRLEIVYRNGMQELGEEKIKSLKEDNSPKLRVLDLTLRWDLEIGQETEKSDKSLSLLGSLQSHSELRVLVLVGYESSGLPAWFATGFESLVKLSLQDCPGCNHLTSKPLPKLRILELIRLDNLEYVEQECVKGAGFYETLVELKISDCPKLESWWQKKEVEIKDRPVFRRIISKLHVHNCPKLTCMPLYPRLKDSTSSSLNKEMVLEDSSLKLLLDKPVVGSAQHCNIPLENLHIQNCNTSENLCSAFEQLSSLQRLTIENYAQANNLCRSGNQWDGLKSLRFLTLREIPNLFYLPFGNSDTMLRELTIYRCQRLTSIDSIGKLTSLRRLEISECNKLKSLPKQMEKLRSLKTLIILDCDLLLPRCQPETGGDWPQIMHIEDIQVRSKQFSRVFLSGRRR